jgi:hypothetical protein
MQELIGRTSKLRNLNWWHYLHYSTLRLSTRRLWRSLMRCWYFIRWFTCQSVRSRWHFPSQLLRIVRLPSAYDQHRLKLKIASIIYYLIGMVGHSSDCISLHHCGWFDWSLYYLLQKEEITRKQAFCSRGWRRSFGCWRSLTRSKRRRQHSS